MQTKYDRADALDLLLFNAANRFERLAEETGDEGMRAASRVVGAARQVVRKHMTEGMRKRAPN